MNPNGFLFLGASETADNASAMFSAVDKKHRIYKSSAAAKNKSAIAAFGRQTVEREVKTAEDRWFLARVLPYRAAEDQIGGVVLTFLDITSRKRHEEELRESETFVRSTLNSLVPSIAILDGDGKILDVNNAWARFAEENRCNTPRNGIGANYLDVMRQAAISDEPDAQLIFDGIEAVLNGNLQKYEVEYPCHSPTEQRWFSMNASPLDTTRGGAVVSHTDITTRRKTEKALRDSEKKLLRWNEELEYNVEARTSELAEANEFLQQEIVERKQLEGERTELLKKIVGTQEDERRRIARDLHDHLGQQLTALRLKLEILREICGDEELYGQIKELQTIARKVDSDVDFLAWELRPSALDDFDIAAALGNYVAEWSRQFEVPAEFTCRSFDKKRLAPEAENNLYRIAQEALNNIAKHARAKSVDVLLEHRDNFAVMIIEDDGIGFEPDKELAARKNGRGLGLIGMRERAALIGGSLEIESATGAATTIFVRIPIKSEPSAVAGG